jgi:hypothetical protein
VKAELIPTVLYADGRPRDVGTDRKLANLLNALIDAKTAHQSPWLVNTGHLGNDSALFLRPISFGTEHLSSTVTRSLTIAPWYRSDGTGDATVTITLSRDFPTYPAGTEWENTTTNPRFPGPYSQATWTTASTTWQTGADATLNLDVKDLELGFAFLVIEANGPAEIRGLAKCIEGARVVL